MLTRPEPLDDPLGLVDPVLARERVGRAAEDRGVVDQDLVGVDVGGEAGDVVRVVVERDAGHRVVDVGAVEEVLRDGVGAHGEGGEW